MNKHWTLSVLAIIFALSVPTECISKKYELWYDRPAFNRGADYDVVVSRGFPYDEDWERWSLPIGNGYMGATIFGRTDTERIQLSEKTLANRGCYGQGGFTNFTEIYLDICHYQTKDYKRSLSLNDAVAAVSYENGGTVYTREYFANYPSNVIAVKIKANQPGRVSFTVRPVIPYLNTDRKGDNRTGKVTAEKNLIVLSGEMEHFRLAYEAQIKVLNYGGELHASNDASGDHGIIRVNRADSVVLLLTAATSYRLEERVFLSSGADKCKGNPHPHENVSARIASATQKGYDALKKEHIADYQYFFNRVNLSLTEKVPTIPTDVLLENYKQGKRDLYLEELYFQFGRYLLISTSRDGSLPPNLQGGWTQYDYSPWSGGYWHNINIQMNYWPVFNTNLAELFLPFVCYNEAYRKAAEQNAIQYIKKNNPEALSDGERENGWTIGTGASGYGIGAPGGHSGPGTGGFTTKLYWDYYDFTRDKTILKEHVYPALEGMAKFLSKTLKPDGEGHLLADPSSSPENYHKGKPYQTKGCTFDQGMIWENFHDLINAAAVLKKTSPFLEIVKDQIGKLDPVLIGESGQLKEYREETTYGSIGDPHHRHISHLCLLYPGTLINETTPEWLEAARVALKRRGNLSSIWVGWPVAHRLNAWARLKDGEAAYDCYQTLLARGVMENMWGLCPPFQIDSNLGGTAGVAEMLLQSHEGYIAPLPALPSTWKEGKYSGLVARGNFEVSVEWKNGKIVVMEIHSRSSEICRVHYPGIGQTTLTDADGKKVKVSRREGDRVEFRTRTDGTYRFVF